MLKQFSNISHNQILVKLVYRVKNISICSVGYINHSEANIETLVQNCSFAEREVPYWPNNCTVQPAYKAREYRAILVIWTTLIVLWTGCTVQSISDIMTPRIITIAAQCVSFWNPQMDLRVLVNHRLIWQSVYMTLLNLMIPNSVVLTINYPIGPVTWQELSYPQVDTVVQGGNSIGFFTA